ncbi:hypothetical protein MASR1M59_05720 [Melaminivora sp.]
MAFKRILFFCQLVLCWPVLWWPVLWWPVLWWPVLWWPVLWWPVLWWPVLWWPVLWWPVLWWPVLGLLGAAERSCTALNRAPQPPAAPALPGSPNTARRPQHYPITTRCRAGQPSSSASPRPISHSGVSPQRAAHQA